MTWLVLYLLVQISLGVCVGRLLARRQTFTARETYAAYLKGEITPREAERRMKAWEKRRVA